MGFIGAAAIGAAGSIGAAAISSSGGGGGGGGNAFNTDFAFTTPSFVAKSEFNAENARREFQFNRRSTPAQLALQRRFPRILGDLDTLRGEVRPGFGDLTNAGVANIENVRRRAFGDLKETLNRRKVLGSSFGNDALARVDAEFAQQEAQFRAQSKLAEIDAFNNLLQQEFQFIQTNLKQELAESQFAANLAAGLTSVLGGNIAEAQRLATEGDDIVGSTIGSIASEFFGPAIGRGAEQFANQFGAPNTVGPAIDISSPTAAGLAGGF